MSSIPACFYKLNTPTDSVYGSLLQQWRESIQNLQDRWPNVLASPACYTSQVQIAIQLAESLSGLLNYVCINGCTALLYTQFTPTLGCFSVFSMYI